MCLNWIQLKISTFKNLNQFCHWTNSQNHSCRNWRLIDQSSQPVFYLFFVLFYCKSIFFKNYKRSLFLSNQDVDVYWKFRSFWFVFEDAASFSALTERSWFWMWVSPSRLDRVWVLPRCFLCSVVVGPRWTPVFFVPFRSFSGSLGGIETWSQNN